MTIRRVLSVLSPRWREPSICESCGEPFVCGATLMGCWCTDLKVSAEARAELKRRYTRCVCRACLERTAASSQLQTGAR